MSLAQGGKFEHGFLSSAASELFAPDINDIGDGRPEAAPYRVAAAAVLGGTVADLSGGNFANGAVTAAFARMFNDEAHGFLPRGDHPSHYYSTDTVICALSDTCSLSKARMLFVFNSVPFSDGPALHLGTSEAGLSWFGGTVWHVVDYSPTSMTIMNITAPDHIFYPGLVTRKLYESDGYLRISTVGTGTGNLGWINKAVGPALFKKNDYDIAVSMWWRSLW